MNPESPRTSRLNERLEQYWQTLRAGRTMPLESDINMDDIKDIWSHCFLVSVKEDKFFYSYLGLGLVDAYGDDITGKEVAETLLQPHPKSLLKTFSNVTQNAAPAMDESEFINSRGVTVKYRSCVLPLATTHQPSVAFLLGGMNWKAY